MKKTALLLIIAVLSFTLYSCKHKPLKSQKELAKLKSDSLSLIKIKTDSAALSKIRLKKTINIGDKQITVLGKAKLVKKLITNRDGSLYKYRNSERNQSYVDLRITLSSKSKVGDKPELFFPSINLFVIDRNNKVKFLKSLDWSLYSSNNLNIVYLEQIFDYQEKETFVLWTDVEVPIKSKLVISVNKAKNNKIDVDNIISILNP